MSGDLLDAALTYAARGWPVFALAPGSNVPRAGTHGHLDATTDEAIIRSWWLSEPAANVGIATGARSGLAVVDVDVKDGRPGAESAASLDLPPTLTARSPSGGWHAYYQCPPEGARNAVEVFQGIDLRADGGYITAPPSRRGSGGYTWDDESVPVAPLPPSVTSALRPRPRTEGRPVTAASISVGWATGRSTRYGLAALRDEAGQVQETPSGSRNARLNAAAWSLGRLVGGGELVAAEVEDALVAAALAAGLGETEARGTITAAITAGACQPRAAPPARRNGSSPSRAETPGRPVAPSTVVADDSGGRGVDDAVEALEAALDDDARVAALRGLAAAALDGGGRLDQARIVERARRALASAGVPAARGLVDAAMRDERDRRRQADRERIRRERLSHAAGDDGRRAAFSVILELLDDLELTWREGERAYSEQLGVAIAGSWWEHAYTPQQIELILATASELRGLEEESPAVRDRLAVAVWRRWSRPAFARAWARLGFRGAAENPSVREDEPGFQGAVHRLISRDIRVSSGSDEIPIHTSILQQALESAADAWQPVGHHPAYVRAGPQVALRLDAFARWPDPAWKGYSSQQLSRSWRDADLGPYKRVRVGGMRHYALVLLPDALQRLSGSERDDTRLEGLDDPSPGEAANQYLT